MLCLAFPLGLKAQTLAELSKQFPGDKAVMLNKVLEYTIDVKNGQPVVDSHSTQQIEFLDGSAAAYMGSYGFSQSNFQQAVAYEAYTRTPDDKKLKVSESDFKTSDDKESFVFYDDVKRTRFNFPAVEPGAIGNLDVTYHEKDPHLLSSYYFASYIPVINSELKVTVSKDVSLKFRLMGLDTGKIVVTTEDKHRYKIYTFQYKNCPVDKSYNDAPEFEWYSPRVIFYIESYKDDKGVTVPYLGTGDDLFKLNYSYIQSVNTKITPELKHIVDSLTSSLPTPESKARAIYAWVQHSIKYVAFEDGMGGFVPRDAGLVCSRRYGDCKDMASILTEMLNTAGVPAYFTWIGTRDMPYKFSDMPLPLVSNHMISTINLDGKYIFLDGTDPTCVFGTPSAGIQDKEAMIAVTDKEYKILTVPVPGKDKNMISDTTWLEITPDGVKGTVNRHMQGYYATGAYGELMYSNQKDLQEYFKGEFTRGANNFNLDTFRVSKKVSANDIVLSGKFTLPNYAKKLGNDYYLNMNLFKFYQKGRLEYPERQIPVAHEFKYTRRYVTILKIPDGYKLTYLPQSKNFHNDIWGFDVKYEQKNNSIIFTQEFYNDNLILTNDKFKAWNDVLDKLLPTYRETLSLTKI